MEDINKERKTIGYRVILEDPSGDVFAAPGVEIFAEKPELERQPAYVEPVEIEVREDGATALEKKKPRGRPRKYV